MKSLDVKFQARLTSTTRVVERALRTAQQAEKTANEAEKTANEAKSATEELREELLTLRTEVAVQGKKIALLEANPAKVVPGEDMGIAGLLGKSAEETSPSQRVEKLQSRFLSLVQKKESTNTFILGRKAGFAPASRSGAKGMMSVFFPGVKCILSQADNSEIVRAVVPDPNDARKVAEGVRSLWAEFATQGW
jgi:hypothetical protein